MPFSGISRDVEKFKAWQYSVDMEICNIQYRLAQLTKTLAGMKNWSPEHDGVSSSPPPCEAHC